MRALLKHMYSEENKEQWTEISRLAWEDLLWHRARGAYPTCAQQEAKEEFRAETPLSLSLPLPMTSALKNTCKKVGKSNTCDVMKCFCTGVINHHWRFYSQQLDSCHLLFVNQSREWQRTANKVGHQRDEGDIHFDSCVTVETWEEVTHRMVDSPHHHAEQRVAGTEELHFLGDKVLFLGLRLARNGCGNAARRSHLSANQQLLWKSWQNVLPWSHQLTTHYHRCYSFSLRTKVPQFLSSCNCHTSPIDNRARPRQITKIRGVKTNTAAPFRQRFPQPAS